MLNQDLDRCVLVKGWKSSSGWSFPKGKIDEGEADAACAVREVSTLVVNENDMLTNIGIGRVRV